MGTAPSERFGRRLQELRKQTRGWSQQRLADELVKIGWPLDRTAIAKIEKAQRGVSVDDLVALAVALNVSPGWLLAPAEAGEEPAPVVGSVSAPAWTVWDWVDGVHPLPTLSEDEGFNSPEEIHAFRGARPANLRQQEEHSAVQAVKQLFYRVKRVLSHVGKPPRRGDRGLETTLAAARRAVDGVSAELDEIEEQAHDTRGGRR